jgi:hypothetical protein
MREKNKKRKKNQSKNNKAGDSGIKEASNPNQCDTTAKQQQTQNSNNKRQARSPTQSTKKAPFPRPSIHPSIHPSTIHPVLPALPTNPSINANQPRGK